MAKRQSAGEFSKIIAGQWSKSKKRENATREIMEYKKKAHQAVKNLDKGWQSK